jgi:hypothetical protein
MRDSGAYGWSRKKILASSFQEYGFQAVASELGSVAFAFMLMEHGPVPPGVQRGGKFGPWCPEGFGAC